MGLRRQLILIGALAVACHSEPTKPDAGRAGPAVASAASAAPAGGGSVPALGTRPAPAPGSSGPAVRCREQAPRDFLLRKHQLAKRRTSSAERRLLEAARKRAVDYRTRHYGRFPGFGSRRDNPHPPRYYATRTTFMGLPVVVHEKIVPALACVEAALKRDCAEEHYQPVRISGMRDSNSYQDYEVSNHVYGIAIDIDSHLNPCCGCVGHWPEHPACRKSVDSVFERMAMPECWVRTFERYGFYWLGHDELQDTMHFEFLGDPDRILE
jgi:hypothetical protein